MKITAYKFDGDVFENSFREITLQLTVTTGMIQSVIEKSGKRGWKIEKKGWHTLSNRMRKVAVMRLKSFACVIQEVVEALEIKTDKTNIDFYRISLERQCHNYKPLKYWVFNSLSKKSELKSAAPFICENKLTRGNTPTTTHFYGKKIA